MRPCLSKSARYAPIYLALAGIVLAPLFSVGVPGLGDTINHLARMHILATIGHSPQLQRFYEVHWSAIPYLAMDAVLPPLLKLLPITLAGHLFVAACVLLPVAGTAALHYAVHRRASLVPCAAFLVSTNALLSLGFLNFLFSAGVALLLLAAWVATAPWPRWPRAVLFAPAVLVLYFGHAFACAAYCLGVAGFEAGLAVRARFRPARRVMADMTAAFAQAVPALWFAATLDVASGYVGKLHTVYGTAADRLTALLSPMLFLHDGAHAAVLLAALALVLLFFPRMRISPAIWPAALALGLAALATPHVLSSTWGTDLRFPLLTTLVLVASVSVRAGARTRAAAMAGMVALVCVKSADAWAALHRVDAVFRETRQILAGLPRGSRLLVVSLNGHGTGREQVPISTYWHMPLMAVIDRDAFVPTLFTGLTTVRVRPAYRASSTPNGLPVSPAQLWQGLADRGGAELDDGQGARLYHFGWPHAFDYVLVNHYGSNVGPLPNNLRAIAHLPDMDLYRIASDSERSR